MAEQDCTATKVCAKCRQTFPSEGFYASKRFKDGRRKECKSCDKSRAMEWRDNNLDRARQSKRDWAESNKEHVAQYSKDYHAANLDAVRQAARARAARFREDNPDVARARNLAFKHANVEKNRANAREWARQNPEKAAARSNAWIAINNARFRARIREYAKANPEYGKRNVLERRKQLRSARVGWANEFYVAEIYDLARVRSRMTGKAWCVDHVIPLRGKFVCGLHVESNLLVIPARDNAKKSNKYSSE